MKKFVAWLVWGFVRRAFLLLPRGGVKVVARIAARFSMFVMRRRRLLVSGELKNIMAGASPGEIKRKTYDAFFLRALREFEEMLARGKADDAVPVEGLEHIEASLDRGKGVILLTFHFGAHLDVMPALGSRGYKVNQAAAKTGVRGAEGSDGFFSSSFWDRKLIKLRMAEHGDHLQADFIPLDSRTSMRGLFRCLERNEILVIALDGRETGRMIGLPFFDRAHYWFAIGPVSLALKTGAALHPIFVVRDGGTKRLVIEEEIGPVVQAGQEGVQVQLYAMASSAVRKLEEYTRRFPDHYAMYMVEDMDRVRDLDAALNAGVMDRLWVPGSAGASSAGPLPGMTVVEL